MNSRPCLFFDSSALFAGVVSADGESRALLLLAEGNLIRTIVSEQAVVEKSMSWAQQDEVAGLTELE